MLVAAALALLLAADPPAADPPTADPPAADDPRVTSLLAAVDALNLKGGRKVSKRSACNGDSAPHNRARQFFCRVTEQRGAWTVAGGTLEVRRFVDSARAAEVHDIAFERFGAERPAFVDAGSIGWCYLDVVFADDLLFALEYGCGSALSHSPGLRKVHALLLERGVPVKGTHVIGIAGSHSGWSILFDRQKKQVVIADAERFHHFARVVGVKPDDVLWMRTQGLAMTDRVDKLAPDATCVPLIYFDEDASWWKVKGPKAEGFANRRYLEMQPATECRK